MTKKAWIIFIVICVAILGSLIWTTRQGEKLDLSGVDPLLKQSASDINGQIADHTIGNTEAKVVIIEYGDFQCPGCSTASPILNKVAEKYKSQILLIFRNNPLSTIHPNAFAAAAAAESAGKQGKYWEMHNTLYEEQSTWESLESNKRTDYFITKAQALGLDTESFKSSLNDADRTGSSIKKKVAFDKALAEKQNVATSTPAIIVNGTVVTDKYFKDGKIVDGSTSGAAQVWTDADAFGSLIINPILREKGIALPK